MDLQTFCRLYEEQYMNKFRQDFYKWMNHAHTHQHKAEEKTFC